MKDIIEELKLAEELYISQQFEALEFLGFETRNKYEIKNAENETIGLIAEKSDGLMGFLFRHFLGHWRSFSAIIFDQQKRPIFHLDFPFRFFFKTLFIKDKHQKNLGRLEQKFALFRKKFDLYDAQGFLMARVNSPWFKFWTFKFYDGNRLLGSVRKKWSGSFSELLTDRDNFKVEFSNSLTLEKKVLLLSSCIMIDIIYFEKKSS